MHNENNGFLMDSEANEAVYKYSTISISNILYSIILIIVWKITKLKPGILVVYY